MKLTTNFNENIDFIEKGIGLSESYDVGRRELKFFEKGLISIF